MFVFQLPMQSSANIEKTASQVIGERELAIYEKKKKIAQMGEKR